MKTVKIISMEQKNVGGIVRNPGYVLLEGICPEAEVSKFKKKTEEEGSS